MCASFRFVGMMVPCARCCRFDFMGFCLCLIGFYCWCALRWVECLLVRDWSSAFDDFA